MAKRNRYAGVLQPRLVGRGGPETAVLMLYDIEDDRLRGRVANICLDYGLVRIQFSAFLGKLNRNHREELTLRLSKEVGTALARLRVIPLCQTDFETMWVLDQYRLPEETPALAAKPALRVIPSD
jgi:CRISPR-associated protein Cas2